MQSVYIDGGFSQSRSTEAIEVVNPATETVIDRIPVVTDDEINCALTAAASTEDRWCQLPAHDRGEYLRDIARAVRQRSGELVEALVSETGKTSQGATGEVNGAIDYLNYMAEWDRRIEGDILPGDAPREQIHLQRHPYGTVVAISPWNFPVNVTVRKVAPALVTGNTVVVKPSEVAPLAMLQLFKIIDEEVALPDGVVNCVTGGGTVGSTLVTHPKTDMITMTGSRATGKAIMREAAEQLTPVSLELGGKAPAIVMNDADLEQAVEALTNARIVNAGQGCACVERIYVQSGIADEFTQRYVREMTAVEPGRPADDPDMGPQVSQRQLEKVQSAVDKTRAQGGTVLTGGECPAELSTGYFYEPTVIKDVSQEMEIMQQEVFGPVSPIMEFKSVAQALEYANDSAYGLTSYVFTNDYKTAMRVANNLEFGETFINRTVGASWQGHHIGWDESGMGGEDGKYGLLKYTRIKSVYHNYDD